MKKAILLVILAIPCCIYLGLKFFGTNSFSVKEVHKSEVNILPIVKELSSISCPSDKEILLVFIQAENSKTKAKENYLRIKDVLSKEQNVSVCQISETNLDSLNARSDAGNQKFIDIKNNSLRNKLILFQPKAEYVRIYDLNKSLNADSVLLETKIIISGLTKQ